MFLLTSVLTDIRHLINCIFIGRYIIISTYCSVVYCVDCVSCVQVRILREGFKVGKRSESAHPVHDQIGCVQLPIISLVFNAFARLNT